MRRAGLVNGALLALALGTLGLVWATRDATTTAELEARKSKLFTTWNDDAITRIRLQRGQQALELVREPPSAEFRLERPWRERADVATVRSLLGALELASPLRPADGVTQTGAGLDPPWLEISLEIGGKPHRLRLGGPAPAPPGARYAEVREPAQEPRLYTVSPGLVGELDLPWDKFRETRLLDLGRSDLAKLTIDSQAGRSELVKRNDTFMLVRSGAQELADGEALDRLLTGLSRIVSEQFVDPEAARPALGGEAVRLQLQPLDTKRAALTLTLGRSCPGAPEQALVLREGGEQPARAGCIPREVGEALRVTPEQLELKRPFSARVDEVEELELRRGDQKLELSRKDGGFLLKLPSRSEVPLDAGTQRLRQLVAVKAERVPQPDLAALGLSAPQGEAVIHLSGADGQRGRRELVKLGKPRADGSLCLQREADAVVLCLAAADAAAFLPDATLLKSLELTSFTPSQLAGFTLETPQLRQQVRRNPDGTFTLEEPQGYRHDGALVSDALQLLGDLHAERWVAGQAAAEHGLASPRLRADIELLADPKARRELRVGSPAEAGFFATLSPDPGVFVLARSSVLALESPLLDRALCPVPRAELARIELERGSKRLVLTRRDEVWEASGSARAGDLAETLSSLRAEQTVHLGPPGPGEGLAAPSLVVRFIDTKGTARRLRVGARDTLRGANIAYARLDGVDATYALSATTLNALQDF
jgi:hypothetical protein